MLPSLLPLRGWWEFARVGRRRGKFSTSVSLICGGWLPQVPGCVAGWRVSRSGRGLVRAAHSSAARASGLRGPAPPHPSGGRLSMWATARSRRPRGSRRARGRTRRRSRCPASCARAFVGGCGRGGTKRVRRSAGCGRAAPPGARRARGRAQAGGRSPTRHIATRCRQDSDNIRRGTRQQALVHRGR